MSIIVDNEEYLTITEVARLFNVGWQTISRWTKEGKLKAYIIKVNGIRRYKKSEIEEVRKPKPVEEIQNENI